MSMPSTYALLAIGLLFSTATAASAAENWFVFKKGADAWMFDKTGLVRDPTTGFMRIQVGRLYGEPQEEAGLKWNYEIRRYIVDCSAARAQRGVTERYTTEGRRLPLIPADPASPWGPSSFGWPLMAKNYACDPSAEKGGVKVPGKIAAMATMTTVLGAPSTAAPASSASASTGDFCKTIRTVLGEGQMQTPYFNAFYLNASEKTKYAGLGCTAIPGFGTCRIQQSMIRPHKGVATFASYYCEKVGGTESGNAAFAASVSKQVETCLQTAYFVSGNDGGQSIKTYDYEMSLGGFPRVRVRHLKEGVTIHLDAK